ncbi:ubiquitin-conjugating enzyme [Colletotrichum zoysiae]|uniref:Ubiquitin-conjugating enzyme n=1 Tax=Colletotrichum zoysiae TaxID=1216348 RepID=A0AAD9HKL9_9PEZI|nr:ubiquitin-conjugating enzyme [Colletotrichum zoysiae]
MGRPPKKMSYKIPLSDFLTKGEPREDAQKPSQSPSGISPGQPATKRSLEQDLDERKKKSALDLPPPATEHSPPASLHGSCQNLKTNTKPLTPCVWLQDEQGDVKIKAKEGLTYNPPHSLPSSSSNPWFSKLGSNALGPSQSHSPAQALAEFHRHLQDSHGSTSLSSPKSPPGKPVECAKSETPAADASAAAFHLSYDDFPAITKTSLVNPVPTWVGANTQSSAYGKGTHDTAVSMTSTHYMKTFYGHVIDDDPFSDTAWEAIAPNQKPPILRQPDPSQAIYSTNSATMPRQSVSANPNISSLGPPSEEEQKLRAFVQRMVQHQCPGCDNTGKPFEIGDVSEYTQRILMSKKSYPIFKCHHQNCHVHFCPACMKKGKRAADLVQQPAGSRSPSTWCCPSARLFVIFILLCGPHGHLDDGLASLIQDCQANATIEPSGPWIGSSTQAGATGCPQREPRLASGTGYGGPGDYASTAIDFTRFGDEEDSKVLPGLFATLREVWPSPANSSQFDQDPPELLLAMARRSPLMAKVAELLRNDCVEDVMHRTTVYQPMFDFIRVVVAHPFTALLVRDPRTEYPLRRTLLPVCFGPEYTSPSSQQVHSVCSKGKGKEKAPYEPPQDTLQPLASLLSSLTDQSRAVMHYMDPGNEDATEILAMCQRICDFSRDISRPSNVSATQQVKMPNSARLSTSPHAFTKSTSAAARVKEAYEKNMEDMGTWLSVNKVAELETDDWLEGYSFSRELAETAGSGGKIGRVKRLVYDLSILQTSLPEGIFVRHHGSRLDAMKVLIVGPEGTPYENGLFEFDLFCPLDYPDAPPKMLFRTTGSGRRFNPNLYVCGKVCLSLLGTWDGKRWCPKTSTLLQLLVSIQAMIFCADPLSNEPGVSSSPTDWTHDLYNWEMRADTLLFAMSDWLGARKTNPANNPWDEVVGRHFELRWRRILETAMRWQKENDTEVSFRRSGLAFIMPEKRAAKRFCVGIQRLKGHFAEWARTEEDKALVQLGPEQESQAFSDNVSEPDQDGDYTDFLAALTQDAVIPPFGM